MASQPGNTKRLQMIMEVMACYVAFVGIPRPLYFFFFFFTLFLTLSLSLSLSLSLVSLSQAFERRLHFDSTSHTF